MLRLLVDLVELVGDVMVSLVLGVGDELWWNFFEVVVFWVVLVRVVWYVKFWFGKGDIFGGWGVSWNVGNGFVVILCLDLMIGCWVVVLMEVWLVDVVVFKVFDGFDVVLEVWLEVLSCVVCMVFWVCVKVLGIGCLYLFVLLLLKMDLLMINLLLVKFSLLVSLLLK